MSKETSVVSGKVTSIGISASPIKIRELQFNWGTISNAIQLYNHLTSSDVVTPEWKYTISRRILKYQSPAITGKDVKKVQQCLISLGYSVGPTGDDGIFGKNTDKAVKYFQKKNGLKLDGIVGPETRTFLGLQGAAAYVIGTQFTVKAKFTAPEWITSAEIWASSDKDGFDGLGSVADPSKPVLVNFTKGESDFYDFKIKTPAVSISLNKTKWQWKCVKINRTVSSVKSVGSSDHIIYIICDKPEEPMKKPWVAVLHKACKWAKNESTLDKAAAKVTEQVNASIFFEYDTSHGATNYASNGNFNCSMYLERLNGEVGKGKLLNCTDCACIVSTFANALGCKFFESVMGYDFQCNKIIPIGFINWQVPFGWGFSYHEVAWTGACSDSDILCDACLKVDGDTDPTKSPHTELLPINTKFHVAGQTLYKERLAANTPSGLPNCNPKPTNMKRRSVI